MTRYIGLAAIVALATLVSACQTGQRQSSGRFGPDSPSATQAARHSLFGGSSGGIQPGAMQRGTDQFLSADALSNNRPSKTEIIPGEGGNFELALVNASIPAAAKAVLGDALGLDYVVSDKVQGTVTIQTTGPVEKSVLLDLFEAALDANDAKLTKNGGVVEVVPGSSGDTTFKLAGQSGGGAAIVVAPLHHISAAEMANLLEPLTQEGLKVMADKKRNLLLLSGPEAQQRAALDALNLFDVDVLSGKSIALVQLTSADPEAVVDELNQIFESEEGGMLNGVVEFVPNRRLSSVLVVTSRAQYLDKAARWIRELDTTASDSAVYLATYPLQNRAAAEVAPILNELLANGSGEEPTLASGETSGESESAKSTGDIRVAADDSTNAVIVRAKRADHSQVKAILAELDASPRQVLLEATIAEVSLNNELNLGTRWFFESGNWGFRFSDLDSGSVAPNGASFAGVFKAGGAELAISALEGVTDVKIISAPTLMVLDNREGALQIGDQVPVATQTSTSTATGNAPVLTQVDYRDTGVILRVKPRVGNGGRVILDITQEVSDVKQTRTSGIDSPTIRQRKIQTTVALGNGQTLALGGLVQEGDNVSRSQTPGLGKIPVVGNLFRSKESSKARSELLIMIRPRVVNGDAEAASATNYWRAKLAGTNSILGTGLGRPGHTIEDFVE